MNEENQKADQTESLGEWEYRRWHRHQKPHILFALILITLGSIVLLNNFGVLPWSIWNLILRFWPVVLILAGFQAIFGHSWIGRILFTLVGLAVIVSILAYSVSSVDHTAYQWLHQQLPWWNLNYFPRFENMPMRQLQDNQNQF